MSLAERKSHLVLTIAGCFGGGSLYGWSGLLPAVRAHFDVSNASAAMVFSLALVSFTCGVLLGPVAVARVRPRMRLPVIAGLAAVCLVGAGASTGFASFALAYGVCFGVSSGALYNLAISMASASERPTLLVPVSVAAFGLGGAVFGPVQVWLTQVGWGLWSVAPALLCLGGVAGGSLVLKQPAPRPAAAHSMVLAMARPDRSLAVLWVIFAAGSCSGLIVLGFAGQFLARASGGVGLAGLAIFLAALGNTAGRLSSAWTVARFGPPYGLVGALSLSIISLAGLLLTTTPGAVVGALFLIALSYGQVAATTPLLVKSQVGDAAFSNAFGWVFTGWGVAGLVGPWTAGWLLDATGTLRAAVVICMVLAMLSLWLVLRIARTNAGAQRC